MMKSNITIMELPVMNLSNVLLNWSIGETRKKLLIEPIEGRDDWCREQTRDVVLAATIAKDVSECRVIV